MEIDSYIHGFDWKFDQNFFQNWPNFCKKCSQNAPWTLPSGVQTAFGVHLGVGNASKTDFPAFASANLDQNCSKIGQKSTKNKKKYRFQNQLWIRHYFLIDFWSNFDQFWSKNDIKFWSNFKITCNMLNMLKCVKTNRFLLILLDRGFDAKQNFEWKIDQKTKSNTDIDFESILGQKMV